MTAIAFDTLQFVKNLQAKGFAAEQAEGISDAFKDILIVAEIATKTDIKELKYDIQELRLEIKAEIAPLKWMIGVTTAGIISLLIKAFL